MGLMLVGLNIFEKTISGQPDFPPQPLSVFDPMSLPERDRLLVALSGLAQAMIEPGPDADDRIMMHGRVTASLLETIYGSPLTGIPDTVELAWVGSPGRMSKGMIMLIDEMISALEGHRDPPPTIKTVHRIITRMVWPWRMLLAERGLVLDQIVNAADMPSPRRRTMLLPAGDTFYEMRQRLSDVSVLDRIVDLKRRFEIARTKHLDPIDATQTRSLIDTHLPDLARRFVTAYDASSVEARTDAQNMVMSSLELVEAALKSTMDRHAANARHELEDQRRFLEGRVSDPWSEAGDDVKSN